MRRHGQLLADHFGEDKGMRDMRKHIAWYLHGFPAGADAAPGIGPGQDAGRARTRCSISSTRTCRSHRPPPVRAAGRGHWRRWALPEGWLADPDDCTVPAGADVMHSGG